MFSRVDISRVDINSLPLELLLKICLGMGLGPLSRMALVNHKFHQIILDSSLWEEKRKQHFPHRVTTNISFDKFREIYESEYRRVPRNTRKLFSFVKEEDASSLAKTLKLKNLDKADGHFTLLDWVIKKNNPSLFNCIYEIAKKELGFTERKNEIKTDHAGRTVLHWAIICGQPIDDIDLFIQKSGGIGANALCLAARTGNLVWIKALLKRNVSINAADGARKTPLYYAAANGHVDVVKFLLGKKYINIDVYAYPALLYIAADNGHVEVLKVLLEYHATARCFHGYNVRGFHWYNNDTPFHAAAKRGHVEVLKFLIKFLLEKEADIDAVTHVSNSTPLHFAAENGHDEVIKLLLENHANVDAAAEWNETPLHLAAKNGHVEAVKVLLEKESHINAVDEAGDTPLHLAAANGRVEVVKILLDHHANIKAVNKHNKTPLDLAIEDKYKVVIASLIEQRVKNRTSKVAFKTAIKEGNKKANVRADANVGSPRVNASQF